ncbi:hypothetical protein PybrP1_008456 [[Pythium] brassicae (nom. inval.)]|nr:hypothetical protein PybrP1_008456 [[Pythium] brassicae (nom. inval.)]
MHRWRWLVQLDEHARVRQRPLRAVQHQRAALAGTGVALHCVLALVLVAVQRDRETPLVHKAVHLTHRVIKESEDRVALPPVDGPGGLERLQCVCERAAEHRLPVLVHRTESIGWEGRKTLLFSLQYLRAIWTLTEGGKAQPTAPASPGPSGSGSHGDPRGARLSERERARVPLRRDPQPPACARRRPRAHAAAQGAATLGYWRALSRLSLTDTRALADPRAVPAHGSAGASRGAARPHAVRRFLSFYHVYTPLARLTD